MKSKKKKQLSATKSQSSTKAKRNLVSENETVIFFRLKHSEKENLQAKAKKQNLSVNMLLRKFAQS